MRKRLISVLLAIFILSFGLGLNVSAKTAAETFILFIEAEDCVMGGYTIVDSPAAGAIGKVITCATPEDDAFTLNFNAPADGKYTIWFKVWHVTPSGSDENSVFYEYDGERKVFDFEEEAGTGNADYFMLKRWYWMQINERGSEPLANGWSEWGEANNQVRCTPVVMNLKAGANSIEFVAREAGHFIDQIIVTDNLEYNPADVPGNETYLNTFNNLPHFKLEPYADFGKTPEQYWAERLLAENPPPPEPEPEAPAPDSPAAPEEAAPAPAPTTKPAAPPTGDAGMAFVAAMVIAAAGIAVCKKRLLTK